MTGFTIAAVGDVALLRPPGADLFRAGWDDADVRIANLEAPLTQGGVPAAKLTHHPPLDLHRSERSTHHGPR